MIKTLLAPSYGRPSDAPVLDAALALARAFDAHLSVLHVHLDVADLIVSLAASDPTGAGTGAGLIEGILQDADRREEAAKRAFEAWRLHGRIPAADQPRCPGPSVEWVRETGQEAQSLARHGRMADLIVTGRGPPGSPVPVQVLEAALLQTGRPLLLLPQQPPALMPGTVAIAWKDRPEAARAVAAAMPLLRRAGRVVVLCADEGAGRDPSAERLVRALSWHHGHVSLADLPQGAGPPVEALLRAAAELGAGLLVMGGYGHSRLREFMFGGFTERVLHSADLPVLMTH